MNTPGPERSVDIMDVTLRDGSYVIDFQFTASDTANIAAALESVGVRWIEVGHGLGLNASEAGKGRAAASDEAYLEATAAALTRARWGMFCIPGIARLVDLDIAARYRMPFIRVGADVRDLDKARPFLERARELGFFVSCNAMKSYAASASEFGKFAAGAAQSGADLVCLVDSAGGMFPEDITKYLQAARNESGVQLGFHGHDNLSLAMANTLRAIEDGVVLVDSSLQGMGRSAGNTVTEALVAILKQRGRLTDIDLNGLMDAGQALVQPLMQRAGRDPMAITSGYARFHSSFTAKVKQYAERFSLDPRDLIVRLTQEDMFDAPDELLERIGRELAVEKIPRVSSIPVHGAGRPRAARGRAGLESLLDEMRPLAIKSGKFSVLNVVAAERTADELTVSANIQNSAAHVIAAVTYTGDDQLEEALRVADGRVDVVFLDVDPKATAAEHPARAASSLLEKSMLLTYFDSRVWVDAVEDQVVRWLGEALDGMTLVIVGDHPKSRFLALRFAERFGRVVILREPGTGGGFDTCGSLRGLSFDPEDFDLAIFETGDPRAQEALSRAEIVIAWPAQPGGITTETVRSLGDWTRLLDAGVSSLTPEAMSEAMDRKVQMARVNLWPALCGALDSIHESSRVRSEAFGWGEIDGVAVVAGGAMGRRGDVIVDSVKTPTRVIGLADGLGRAVTEYGETDEARIRRVQDAIARRMLEPRL